jgi:hypothetical protein
MPIKDGIGVNEAKKQMIYKPFFAPDSDYKYTRKS